MKKEISPVVIIVSIVVLVAVLGFIGFKVMSPPPVQSMDKAEYKRRMGQYMNSTSMGKPVGTTDGYRGKGGKTVNPNQ